MKNCSQFLLHKTTSNVVPSNWPQCTPMTPSEKGGETSRWKRGLHTPNFFFFRSGHVTLVAITGTTITVTYVYVKSLQLSSRSEPSRVDSRFAPSQWEMALLCNDISHWLGASLESALPLQIKIIDEIFGCLSLNELQRLQQYNWIARLYHFIFRHHIMPSSVLAWSHNLNQCWFIHVINRILRT